MIFGRKKRTRKEPGEALGIFLFDEVSSAIRAEKILAATGYEASLVAPPHHLRAGCDLSVAIPTYEQVGARRELESSNVDVRDWVDSTEGTARVCDLVTTVDFGTWLMVRSGNMKITVEKATGIIVNTSGGGCPDIPYLNLELVGKKVSEAPRPKDLGYTLCGLMLDRAFLEVARITEGAAS